MANTSRTGGYITPISTNDNANDKAFKEFMQPLVVGITGLPGAMVRPRWQQNTPNLPDFGTDWAAIGSTRRTPDTFAAVGHESTGVYAGDNVLMSQIVDLLVSFYGPNCESKADLLIMGFQVAQNRETMQLAGYGFISCEPPIITADLLNEQWTPRVDVAFSVRRAQLYTYPVLDLVDVQELTIVSDSGMPSESVAVTGA